jgi:TonB dependent receptor
MEVTGGYNNLNIPQGITVAADQAAVFAAAGLGAGFNKNPGDTPVTLIPGYGLSGGNYSGFWNGAGPIGPMNIIQAGATVTKITGGHSLKFGGSFYHTWMYTNWNGNNMDFSNKGTWNAACQYATSGPTAQCPTYNAKAGDLGGGGDPVASMLLSVPIDAVRNLGNSGVNLIENTPALFAQDSWKIGPRLTLNYGLRWDYSSPMTERNNRLATYDFYNQRYSIVAGDVDLPSGALPANTVVLNRHSIVTPHYNNFSPRLGIAYQVTAKTTLRAGAGRTFDDWGLPLQVGQQNRGAWPSGLSQNASSQQLNIAGISVKPDGTPVTGQNPFFGPAALGASPLPAGGLGFQDINWVPADSFQWNLEVQQDLGKIGSWSLAYVGSHTSHQTLLQPYNTAQPSTNPVRNYPDKIFGGVGSILRSTAGSNYESFQTKLMRSFANGLAYNAAFTWSNTLSLSSCNGDFSNVCLQNIYNQAGDYGPSYLSIPLLFTFNATYQLPFGKGKRYATGGVGSAVFGNWQVNGIVAARSGTVINPTNGANGDTANVGGGNQRINYVGKPNSGAPHSKTAWFNASAFALPANGTFGNASINSLRGPGYRNVDFSLFRDFPFTERATLQFRVESFDVFNHPNLANPNGSFSGVHTNSDGSTSLNGSFNTITSTVPTTGPGANRDIQLALKLLF